MEKMEEKQGREADQVTGNKNEAKGECGARKTRLKIASQDEL